MCVSSHAIPNLSAIKLTIHEQMTSKNLAVVFAPSIMRDVSLEREMTDMAAKSVAVQFLIENSDKIFATE